MAQKKSLYIHKNGKSVQDKRFKQVQTTNKTRANTKKEEKMSCLQNELLLEALYEEVLEKRPELSELEAIRLTEELWEDMQQ